MSHERQSRLPRSNEKIAKRFPGMYRFGIDAETPEEKLRLDGMWLEMRAAEGDDRESRIGEIVTFQLEVCRRLGIGTTRGKLNQVVREFLKGLDEKDRLIERADEEIERVIGLFGELDADLPGDELYSKMTIALRAWDALAPITHNVEERFPEIANFRDWHAEMTHVLNENNALMREAEREDRIRSSRRPDPVIVERKCSQCNKKPARVGDLCKKCAKLAGTLPKGKIT